MQKQELNILQEAAAEIRQLRKVNELQAARYASQVEELKVENERLRVALNGIRDKAYSLNIPYELYKDNKWVRGLHTEINGIIDAATDALKPKEEQ